MLNQIWTDPASWTTEQWLAVCILGFILMAILVIIHRLLTVLKISRKQTYRPNFRRLRRGHPGRIDTTRQDSDED